MSKRYAACLLLVTGCFTSGGNDPCSEEKTCYALNALGCCGADALTSRSICEVCPAGTAERRDCRTTGCEVPPECDAPLFCVEDFGGGCCGAQVFNRDCGVCPAGSTTPDGCTEYQPECGCDEIRPLIPPMCVRDLGGGCCDSADVQEVSLCGCPDGFILNYECMQDIGIGPRECAPSYDEGCCGIPVASACGVCPADTLPVEECMSFGNIGPPQIRCYEDLGGDLCGCDVTECTGCPDGSIPEYQCLEFECPMP